MTSNGGRAGRPVWEEPRTDGRKGRTHAALVMARTRPGAWLRMPGDYAGSVAWQIRNSRYSGMQGERWEAKSHAANKDRTRHHIWIRYIGNEDES